MRSKIFKTVTAILIAFLVIGNTSFAQDTAPAKPEIVQPEVSPDVIVTPSINITSPVSISVKPVTIDLYQLKTDLKQAKVTSNLQVKALLKDINADVITAVNDITPQISLGFKDGTDFNNPVSNNDDVDLEKKYSKVYPADANDNLSISNLYGKVIVNTWARNEVKVDVEIKVGADDNEAAQKALDNVTVSDSKQGNNIYFKTSIGEKKNSWMSIFGGDGGSHHIEINYIVYMPAKNALTIDNRYGPIVIPDIDGKVTIYSAYGSFKAGALANQSNIVVKYGSADIQSLGNCAIEVGYGGGLTIGSVNKIAANVSYAGVKIGKLRESAAINVKYGDGVIISDMDKNVKSVAINASYTNVNIGFSTDENSNFAVVTHYGDFNYDGHDVTISSKTPDDSDGRPHFTKSYKGYLGKGGSDKTIAINCNYGNVKFQ
jgi:hypothetical protein